MIDSLSDMMPLVGTREGHFACEKKLQHPHGSF